MSAKALISTPTKDRVGDILDPAGCKLDNYRKNPVVLWGHGIEGVSQPIGSSEDPDGNLSIEITDEGVWATCYFAQKSLIANQIFQLIDEGVVRATSVRETPLKMQTLRDRETGELLAHVSEWDLEEWSWCSIGVNPDAVAKTIDRGKLCGKAIHKSIMKSLKAAAPKRTTQGIGINLPEEKVVNMDDEVEDDGLKSKKKADKVEKKPADEIPAEDKPGAKQSDTDNDDPASCPYGQQFLQASHAKLKDAIDTIGAAYGANEHPDVKDGMKQVLTNLKGELTTIQGIHAATYPTAKCLKSDDIEGGEPAGMNDDADDEEMKMKSFLALGANGYQMQGIIAQCKSLSTASNLTSSQRKLLADVIDHQSRLLASSKSLKAAKPVTKNDDDAKLAEALKFLAK